MQEGYILGVFLLFIQHIFTFIRNYQSTKEQNELETYNSQALVRLSAFANEPRDI